MDRNCLFGLLVACAALAAGIGPAAAASGSLLGTWKSWSAYSTSSGGKQVCYALSTPRASDPKGVKRGPIYFLVNDWPDRHTKGETEIVAGYSFKESAAVGLQIGSDKFAFFARNNSGDGDAWVKLLSDGPRVIAAMQKGASMVVTGTSSRGTVTRDTYALDGFADALAKIDSTCKM